MGRGIVRQMNRWIGGQKDTKSKQLKGLTDLKVVVGIGKQMDRWTDGQMYRCL